MINQTIIIKNSYTLPILSRIDLKIRSFPFQESHYIKKYEYDILLCNIKGYNNNYYDHIPYGDYKIRCRQ